jgi:hypothetical protein
MTSNRAAATAAGLTSTRAALRAAALLLVVFALTAPAHAQRASGDVALGIEVGEPSGVTLFFYSPQGPSWDFLAAWDLDDFLFVNLHALYERHLADRSDLHLFYGPGAFAGFRDRGRVDDDVVVGISGTVGIGLLIEQFEVYGRLVPRLSVVPATDGDIGAGLGVRYYF